MERIDETSLKIKWKQIGAFIYPISRYIIKIKENEQKLMDYFDDQYINASINKMFTFHLDK